jgi:Zn-finger nucleic acid-binding protein
MHCPVDNAVLQMTDRQGVEIDYCPQCRGVWLDRGELDKIIDRSADIPPAASPAPAERPREEPGYREEPRYRDDDRYRDDKRYRDDDRYRNDPRYYKKKRKESFLGELFDF